MSDSSIFFPRPGGAACSGNSPSPSGGFAIASAGAAASSPSGGSAATRGREPLLPIGREYPWLAPLAGFSDLPFRLLCREQGAAVACTEMVSAKGLIYGERGKRRAPKAGAGAKDASDSEATDGPLFPGAGNPTLDLLSTMPEDAPLVVQLFGAEADFVGEAAALLRGRGFCWFDLNMGCSVPKVTRAFAGAAMLRDPANALAVARALVSAAGPGRVGFKLRLGWDAASPVFLDLGRALEDAGAAWLTLHPRYARQGFSGVAEAKALEALARAVSIPVLASGDLFTAETALERLDATGVAGVMLARGAMADPFIFRRYHALLRGEAPPAIPAPAELHALIRRHAELARVLTPGRAGKGGRSPALLKMRTVAPRYVRHLPGVKALRQALAHCESWEELDGILNGFFKPLLDTTFE